MQSGNKIVNSNEIEPITYRTVKRISGIRQNDSIIQFLVHWNANQQQPQSTSYVNRDLMRLFQPMALLQFYKLLEKEVHIQRDSKQ